jgi:hypothetical protein
MSVRYLLALGMGLSLVTSPPAFGGNTAGQKGNEGRMCFQLVAAKHLKTKAEKTAEFDKCKTDPMNYK